MRSWARAAQGVIAAMFEARWGRRRAAEAAWSMRGSVSQRARRLCAGWAGLYSAVVKQREWVLVVVGVVVIVLAAVATVLVPRLFPTTNDADAPDGELVGVLLPRLTEAAGWLNGGPLPADSLRGHPTVIALWSDTDPECLRALPILQGWYQAYARYGVRIIGVHEPDYAFAADSTVPARVAFRFGLHFPIALDPAYAIRRRLGGPLDGPRVVLANGFGRIMNAALGRGQLPVIERALRAQLKVLHPELQFPADPEPAAGSSPAAELPDAHVVQLGSTEVREGPLVGATPGRAQPFIAQLRSQVEGILYVPYPVGMWSPGGEGITAGRGGPENFIALRYHSGALWAVLSPPPSETARLWVLLDEKWLPHDALGADARLDSRGASYVEIDEPRVYAVCRELPGHHIVKLSPDAPGIIIHALIVEPVESRATRE
jgi:thiol-disulfide isomerase/thioredoxin